MLEKVKFKTWILLLHTSAISKSYSTYKKCQLGYEISTTVGQNWLLYAGNALERVQRVHEPADLWDITF